MTTPATWRVLLTATAVLCLVSACGGGASPGDGRSSDQPSPQSEPNPPAPPPTTTPPEDLVVAPSGRSTVLTGTVEAGVEPGCLLLGSSGVLHQLVGATQGLAPGQRVTVQGRPDPALLTTCQQGTPFVVSSSAPA